MITDDFKKLIDGLPTYYIEIGVFSTNNKRKNYRLGITNAELMFIHENGSPLRHIPARPVLKMALAHAQAELVEPAIKRGIKKYLATNNVADYEKELDRLCVRLQNYARQIIYSNDGRLAPNAPSTIARKGDNHPLFDTGQLARSITCKLVKEVK